MATTIEAAVTWPQALAWRMGRHLLDPVGSASAAAVVRRLGGVLSMDESLAELAVRTRSATSRPGELTKALAEGTVIKVFAFRGSMHYLSPEDGGIYLALRSAGRHRERMNWTVSTASRLNERSSSMGQQDPPSLTFRPTAAGRSSFVHGASAAQTSRVGPV